MRDRRRCRDPWPIETPHTVRATDWERVLANSELREQIQLWKVSDRKKNDNGKSVFPEVKWSEWGTARSGGEKKENLQNDTRRRSRKFLELLKWYLTKMIQKAPQARKFLELLKWYITKMIQTSPQSWKKQNSKMIQHHNLELENVRKLKSGVFCTHDTKKFTPMPRGLRWTTGSGDALYRCQSSSRFR